MASAAALNTVRYSGYGCLTLIVHCATTPATAITTACRGPSSSSDIRSAAYDTESVEPLESAIGSVTFQIDVTQPNTSSPLNSHGCGSASGRETRNAKTPRPITNPT